MKVTDGDDLVKRMSRAWLVLGGVIPLLIGSCAPSGVMAPAPAPTVGQAMAGSSYEMPRNSPSAERPGLGTGWGRSVSSAIDYTRFERGSSKPYGGPDVLYYNDREGVEAMTGWKRSGSSMQSGAGGLVEWGVKASSGYLKNYNAGSRRFVVGKQGQGYSLLVKNKAKSRLEVVLSVDGLDVMDGKSASTRKRGYIVAPGKTLEVKGWRTSHAAVASFRFSGVGDSYGNLKHGETRNVGVIGLAVYPEKGVDPFTWMPVEVEKRHAASPFAEAPTRGAR